MTKEYSSTVTVTFSGNHFKAESKKDCPGIGLTNSRGNLCLDENTMNLLVTRGGNRSTGPAEIGN